MLENFDMKVRDKLLVILTSTLAAWPLRCHTALKSIFGETLFQGQLFKFILTRDVRGMKISREFPFPFPVFPGIAGMGMKNPKTGIIQSV